MTRFKLLQFTVAVILLFYANGNSTPSEPEEVTEDTAPAPVTDEPAAGEEDTTGDTAAGESESVSKGDSEGGSDDTTDGGESNGESNGESGGGTDEPSNNDGGKDDSKENEAGPTTEEGGGCVEIAFPVTRWAEFDFVVGYPYDEPAKTAALAYSGCVDFIPISIHRDCLDINMRQNMLIDAFEERCMYMGNSKMALLPEEFAACEPKSDDRWVIDYTVNFTSGIMQIPERITEHVHAFEGDKLTAYCTSDNVVPESSFMYGKLISFYPYPQLPSISLALPFTIAFTPILNIHANSLELTGYPKEPKKKWFVCKRCVANANHMDGMRNPPNVT